MMRTLREDKLFSTDDPFLKVRTMSEAEFLVSEGKSADMGENLHNHANSFDYAMPHRWGDPSKFTLKELAEDGMCSHTFCHACIFTATHKHP